MMFYGPRIRQARELREFTQGKLAKAVGVSQALIASIETELRLPSEALLAKIAQALTLPIAYFSEPQSLEIPPSSLLFRARASISNRAVTEASRVAEHVLALATSLAKHVDIPVHVHPLHCDPTEAARRIRELLRVPPLEPIPALIRSLERLGIWVLALPVLKDRDAFCMWIEIDGRSIPTIAVCMDQPGDRLRLSVAHELGHLLLHKDKLGRIRSDLEKEAFAFGAELLMPEAAMRKELLPPVTLTTVSQLKPRWLVSMQALIRRGHDLRIVTERQYHYLFQRLSAAGWRKEEPNPIAIERPMLIRKMAEVAYGTPLDYRSLAAACHMLPQEAERLLSFYAAPKAATSGVTSKVVSFPRKRVNA
ncbi:XRE family transcriptional regulator (plasmid) [Tunturibacter empetritectus]|uniref:XRE family transcriptional regulator n=1 Tax=Tunturiibacter empetritectus TaxID=3069691 RepID=A0AAU7ZJ31_9BACT